MANVSRYVYTPCIKSMLLTLSCKAVLLVGGFGSNKYLHKRLKDAHNNNGIEVLKVING